MKKFHILVVEDEPLISMMLEMIVTEVISATVVVETSVAGSKNVLNKSLDFVFLDVVSSLLAAGAPLSAPGNVRGMAHPTPLTGNGLSGRLRR